MVSHLFKTLRDLRVLVVHPQDQEGEILLRQLNRIGCQVEAVWPLPDILPPAVDVVFVTVQEEALSDLRRMCDDDRSLKPTLIALIEYESPIVLQAVIDIDADAVMTRPIRPFGVMTNLVTARHVWLREQANRAKLHKLQRKLRSIHKVNQAKSILMETRGISEEEAYKIIRDRAMTKRVTTEEMAVSIINADDLLHTLQK